MMRAMVTHAGGVGVGGCTGAMESIYEGTLGQVNRQRSQDVVDGTCRRPNKLSIGTNMEAGPMAED